MKPAKEPRNYSGAPSLRALWPRLLWALVFPRNTARAEVTVSGAVLMALCFGVGMAAYNSANNILFITLSLLLGSLILSGVLSWLNLRELDCEFRTNGPYRAGQAGTVEIIVRNRKARLPSQALWFSVSARPLSILTVSSAAEEARKKKSFRQRLAGPEMKTLRGRVLLGRGLEAGEERHLVWTWTPAQRGKWRIELQSAGSLFPFGFLRKQLAIGLSEEVTVWPAPITFAPLGELRPNLAQMGQRTRRAGEGSDLLSLRKYAPGDSQRLIHWKASARQRQLMLRQCASEAEETYGLQFETDARLWQDAECFETALRLAASLAENLNSMGKLRRLFLDGDSAMNAWRRAELEDWLDRLALAVPIPSKEQPGAEERRSSRDLIRFRAQGSRGAAAYVDGRKITEA
jgi:uncharacterized protein (DUF58 family)